MNLRADELREKGNPYWVDVLPAGEFLGLADKTILHAGPPIEFARMCRGHRRSMVNACFFEGWAKTEAEAVKLLESGEVKCEAAYDYATDGSGYGIITKSVPLLIVEDRDYGSRAGLFPSEGKFGGGFTGWGVYSDEIAANLKWIGSTLFAELVCVLKDAGGFPMRDLFAEARRMGDELHSSQKAIDPLFTRAIIPYCLKCGNAAELLGYFVTADRFTHNFGQASSRALVLGMEKAGERGFLTAAGGNGVEYGVKFAGSDEWHVAPSPMIEGPYLTPGAKRENQLPWIGDSSITECRGWGGQIRPIYPEFEAGAGRPGYGLGSGARRPGYGLGSGAGRPGYGLGSGAGRPGYGLGTGAGRPGYVADASRVGPIINGGMMDVNGGWMGAGSTRMPKECFTC